MRRRGVLKGLLISVLILLFSLEGQVLGRVVGTPATAFHTQKAGQKSISPASMKGKRIIGPTTKPKRIFSDLSIERIYLKNCKIHVVIRNLKHNLSPQDLRNGKLIVELNMKLIRGGKKVAYTFPLFKVFSRQASKRKVDFDTGIILGVSHTYRVTAKLSGLHNDGRQGRKKLLQGLTLPKVCLNQTLPSKRFDLTHRPIISKRIFSDLSIERIYLKKCNVHVVIKNLKSGLSSQDLRNGKLIVELGMRSNQVGKKATYTFSLSQIFSQQVSSQKMRKPQEVDFDTGIILGASHTYKVTAKLSGLQNDGRSGRKRLSQRLTLPKVCLTQPLPLRARKISRGMSKSSNETSEGMEVLHIVKPQADISIEWVRHADGRPITSIPYDPSSPKHLPIKIAVKFTGDYCPVSIGIKGIQVGSYAPVWPPIAVPRPDSSGMSYIQTIITIQKGLQPGQYHFEVFKLTNNQCPDSNPANDRKIVPIGLYYESENACDYSIDSVTLADGRPIDTGCLYSPQIPPPCRIKIRVKWNKISPPYGVACTIGGMLCRQHRCWPLHFPTPDQNGYSETTYELPLPTGESPGTVLQYTLNLRPSDPACDSNRANNSKRLNIKLVRMSGDDFIIRLKGGSLKWEKRPLITGWIWEKVRFKVRVANVSGTGTVPTRVKIAVRTYAPSGEVYGEDFSLDVVPRQWYEKEVWTYVPNEIYDPLRICATVVYNGVEIDKNNNVICFNAKP